MKKLLCIMGILVLGGCQSPLVRITALDDKGAQALVETAAKVLNPSQAPIATTNDLLFNSIGLSIGYLSVWAVKRWLASRGSKLVS